MIIGKLGERVIEAFSVLDASNSLVSGIPISEFNAHIFDPFGNELHETTSIEFSEFGYGHYKVSFIPNNLGTWLLVIYHPTYFPWGKSNTIQVYTNDFDSTTNMLQKILGLVQENFTVDQTVYDDNNNLISSRVRTYKNSSSIGTDFDILDTYLMTATYNGSQMTFYKMEKI